MKRNFWNVNKIIEKNKNYRKNLNICKINLIEDFDIMIENGVKERV